MHTRIERRCEVQPSPRLAQVQGMFDHPPATESRVVWDVDLPLDDQPWNVGAIVGPSGSGKSTVARELFGDALARPFDWRGDRALVDDFPEDLPTRDVVHALSAVGLSSVPVWCKPFAALSTGQQFRATLARTLADRAPLVVVDEFTSVVDRTVAKVASAAVAKLVRRDDRKFIAVTCHYDVLPWLAVDWLYEPHLNRFSRRSLRRRPELALTVRRVDRSAWELFKDHHYLSANLHPSSQCYVGFLEDAPVVFTAVLPFPHPRAPAGANTAPSVCPTSKASAWATP
ncbi:MAG: hypothetical protein ACRDD1_20360 [Planctomycetia bacterium]